MVRDRRTFLQTTNKSDGLDAQGIIDLKLLLYGS
jgi:hypothetical protein